MRFPAIRRFIFRSRAFYTAALAVLGVGTLLVLGSSCTTESHSLSTVDAVLVAPPAVPPPSDRSSPANVVVDLTATEQQKEIAPGVSYDVWGFNGSTPGPMIRVRLGDTVEIKLTNPATNTQPHNIDLHAVNGPGGGMDASNVLPGQSRAFTFKAQTAGLFAYHCAAGIVADHIANGMYGAILVEPANGMPNTVDHEYYVGQSEFYTTGPNGAKGAQDLDYTKLQHEDPTYVVFNGNSKSLVGNNALQAKPGETVRLYFVDGGPNFISSFHVIGEILDRVWAYGGLEDQPLHGLQSVLVPPGATTITDFKVDVPGDYKLVDHAVTRVGLGAAGFLHVIGDANPGVFNPLSEATPMSMSPTAAATPPASATATSASSVSATAVATQGAAASAATMKLVMKDNVFETTALTVAPGERVTFQLDNEGKIPHNLAIADKDGNFGDVASDLIRGGDDLEFEWVAPATAGVYNFRCDIHPQQMTGTITVQ